ncbi:MAG: hypothetical protein IH944_04640 [Armatimonadetes bacterium]|nr:hypothetical protein [Armatimonadota bacterium]
MNIPTFIGNGISPITSTPPPNVAPTSAGYSTSFGAVEVLLSMTQPIPPLVDEGQLPSFNLTYHFEEFYLEIQNGVVNRVDIAGQTIDWSASELNQDGTISVDLGVIRPYDLVGKSYLGEKYTFLSCDAVLIENGVPKPVSWVVRMKHS